MSQEPVEAAKAAVRYHLDPDGIVTLTLDQPGRSANTLNSAYRAAMGAALDRLEAEAESVTGVILTSAKESFLSGADLAELLAVDPADPSGFRAELATVQRQLRRLERYRRPVVAVLGGSALGGGWELALACHHRICRDDDRIRLGLPEVTLGLLPGAGGVSRTVRLLGLERALPLLLEGVRQRPAAAAEAGLVHELAVTDAEALELARAWIAANGGDGYTGQPWDRRGYRLPGGSPADPSRYQLLAAAPAALYARTRGTMPAPEAILACAVETTQVDPDTASQVEAEHLTRLVTGQVAKNLITTGWFQLNEVTAGRSRPPVDERFTAGRVAVLGGGMMGAGIAYACARVGIETVVKEVSAEAATAAGGRVAALLDRDVAAGRLTPERRERLAALISPVTEYQALAGADVVIEAVYEDRAVKNEVLAAAAAAVGPGALLASNTSTLPITGLAAAVPVAADFVGLHFFSPVPRMRLVEIIRGRDTGEPALARAFDLVRQLGKVPIVVGDGRGFFTSRVFGAYATEGIALLAEGVPAALIENEARRAGMAVGPLAVSDEVSLELMRRIRRQTVVDLAAEGRSAPDHPAFEVVDLMVGELGRAGRSAGAGFHDYPADGPKRLWPGLVAHFGGGNVPADPALVRDRLLFAQALEAVGCLSEGVLTSAADANVGSLLGLGFAPWTGGVLQYVNQFPLPDFVARAAELAADHGERFAPPALLREMAADGRTFG